MGSGQPHSAKIAAYKGIYMAVVVAVLSAGGLFILSGYLPGWLTPDPTLQRMIFDVLPLVRDSSDSIKCEIVLLKGANSIFV
jgi:Na+-driven multidrug efflux pump